MNSVRSAATTASMPSAFCANLSGSRSHPLRNGVGVPSTVIRPSCGHWKAFGWLPACPAPADSWLSFRCGCRIIPEGWIFRLSRLYERSPHPLPNVCSSPPGTNTKSSASQPLGPEACCANKSPSKPTSGTKPVPDSSRPTRSPTAANRWLASSSTPSTPSTSPLPGPNNAPSGAGARLMSLNKSKTSNDPSLSPCLASTPTTAVNSSTTISIVTSPSAAKAPSNSPVPVPTKRTITLTSNRKTKPTSANGLATTASSAPSSPISSTTSTKTNGACTSTSSSLPLNLSRKSGSDQKSLRNTISPRPLTSASWRLLPIMSLTKPNENSKNNSRNSTRSISRKSLIKKSLKSYRLLQKLFRATKLPWVTFFYEPLGPPLLV